MLLPYVQLTFHKLTLQTNIGICIGEIANIGLYEMINEWDIVAAYIHLSGPFLSTNFFFEQQFRHVTMDLLYIRHNNWFSLRCLGPWMNHLPCTVIHFAINVCKWELVCNLLIVKRNFLPMSFYIHVHVSTHHPNLTHPFSSP